MGKFIFLLLKFNCNILIVLTISYLHRKRKRRRKKIKKCEYNFQLSALILSDSRRWKLNVTIKPLKNLFPIPIIDFLPMSNPIFYILAITRPSVFCVFNRQKSKSNLEILRDNINFLERIKLQMGEKEICELNPYLKNLYCKKPHP